MSRISNLVLERMIKARRAEYEAEGVPITPELLIQIESECESKLEEIQGIPSDYDESISGEEGG